MKSQLLYTWLTCDQLFLCMTKSRNARQRKTRSSSKKKLCKSHKTAYLIHHIYKYCVWALMALPSRFIETGNNEEIHLEHKRKDWKKCAIVISPEQYERSLDKFCLYINKSRLVTIRSALTTQFFFITFLSSICACKRHNLYLKI